MIGASTSYGLFLLVSEGSSSRGGQAAEMERGAAETLTDFPDPDIESSFGY